MAIWARRDLSACPFGPFFSNGRGYFYNRGPLLGFWRQHDYPPEFPFGEAHLPSLFFIIVVALNAYWASQLFKHQQAPLVAVLIPLGLMQGLLLNIALLGHFGSYVILGFMYPMMGFELVAPLFNAILFARALYANHCHFQEKLDLEAFQRTIWYPLARWCFPTRSFVYFVLVWPFAYLQQALLTLFGQRADGVLRAFVESCGFTFSDPAFCPPPEGHYLCTVATHGHPKLVKPLRPGWRRGHLITVNRQLLIANAFEQWLEEYAPRLHRPLRRFYDRLGIPVDKWSRQPWLANGLYLLMKPLEWIFLAWLYLVDVQPENRVITQYLPPSQKPGKPPHH